MRRVLLVGAALSVAITWGVGRASAQETVTFSSWGGAYQDAETKAFIDIIRTAKAR